MRLFALIGRRLDHSFSMGYFARKFQRENIRDASYEAAPLTEISEFPDLINKREWSGFNVTTPYKESILPYLDRIDETAREIGAVNTLSFESGSWVGYNTDAWGFRQSLLPVLNTLDDSNPSALVLGSGGASRAVCYALHQLNIPYLVVSRDENKGITYQNLDHHVMEGHSLIINTTPIGMFPNVDDCPPIPFERLKKSHFLYDLIYNPKKTVFLTKGIERQCTVKNGLDMLVYQAEKSWEIWNKK